MIALRVLLLTFVSLWTSSSLGQNLTPIQSLLDEQLQKNADRYGVVGQSVLILKNHQLLYRGVHGHANIELAVELTEEHLFPSYSVTKLFTSILMMQLVERGKVELTSSINRYLPYLPQHWQKVTVEHLLSHTSGVPRYFYIAMEKGAFLPDKKAIFKSLENEPEHFVIGTQNRYNNTNFLLLAAILEEKTKKSYRQMVNDIIVQPLKLKDTGHASARAVIPNMVNSYQGMNGSIIKNLDIDWPGYTFSHSALYSTPEDLAIFMTALMKGEFVKKETLYELLTPMPLNNGTKGSYAFGFEFSIEDGFVRIGHDGGNRVKLRHYFSSEDPDDNYTLAYLTNGNTNNVWTDILADSVMSIVAPTVFSTAKLKEQFVSAALAKNQKAMEQVYKSLRAKETEDDHSIERFLLYRAYSIFYGSGAKASIPAFEFLVAKFPDSENAQKSLDEARSKQ